MTGRKKSRALALERLAVMAIEQKKRRARELYEQRMESPRAPSGAQTGQQGEAAPTERR